MRLASGPLIELAAGPYTARLAPQAGGRLASLCLHEGARTQHLLVPWDGADFDEHEWPKAGAFPMLPFANRLPRRGFDFQNQTVCPAHGPAGFAVHGSAHRRAWDVVQASGDNAVIRLSQAATPDWPWAWTAHQEVDVTPQGIQVTLRVANDGSRPMPLCIGWHPYHPTEAGLDPADLDFQALARHDLDEQGASRASRCEPVFGMQRGETAAFAGWCGALTLRPRGGGRLAVACQGAPHLVLHRPHQGDYLCVEPVTVLPGRLGTPAPGPAHGEQALDPGQVCQMTWHCGLQSP